MTLLRSLLTPMAAVILAATSLSTSGCSQNDLPVAVPIRDCSYILRTRPDRENAPLQVIGSWDGWKDPGPVLRVGSDGWHTQRISLPPGEYGYLLIEDGKQKLDPANPLTTFRGMDEVSLLLVQDCSQPAIVVGQVSDDGLGNLAVHATFLAVDEQSPFLAQSVNVTVRNAQNLPVSTIDPKSGTIAFRATGLPKGKSTITIHASDSSGRTAESQKIISWNKPVAKTWDQGILYQIVVDRYRGTGGAQLSDPKTPGSRAGGTLDGVRREIERGTFDALGVGTLWISPVYTNPTEAREGRDGHLYESYHGYWPTDSRGVDARVGGEVELDALIQMAHQHGIRLIFDVVPNHVYETNPRYLEHKGDGFFSDGANKCVCGDPGCGWDVKIESCWFVSYLPDYRYQTPGVVQLNTEDLLWWANRFDADGVRIDAVPMMPRSSSRRMIRGLRDNYTPRQSQLVLGEVFTGGGSGGINTIRYYLGPDGLDSAFDFPLMWALRSVVAQDTDGFDSVESVIREAETSYAGSGSVLARIVGNHDTTRFVSVAAGNAEGDPWVNAPAQPTDAEPYERLKIALAINLTLPGMPLIYYGDEFGLAGRGDPDCRRIMPSEQNVSTFQRSVFEMTKRLATLRNCSESLKSGERTPVFVDRDRYVYMRDAGDGQPVITALSKAKIKTLVSLPGKVVPRGVYQDVVTKQQVELTEGAELALEPLSVRVLVRADSPCR